MEIRGRGNSTRDADKKPYKIRLEKKADIFGLGDAIGLEFTPRGYPVDLVMRNTERTYCKYLGSYYLAENVRIDKTRVDIDELDESITDPDSVEITGGYLLQNDLQLLSQLAKHRHTP